MTSKLAAIAIGLCMACSNPKERARNFDEEAFVQNEVADLRLGIAARDEGKITTGCVMVTTGLERLPSALRSEIEQLCYDDAPRVLLEKAIASAKKDQASNLAQLGRELTCYQLFAEDGLKWAAKRKTPAPALDALVSEYEHLCPEKVASYRARARAH
jgi:hypothetical protein